MNIVQLEVFCHCSSFCLSGPLPPRVRKTCGFLAEAPRLREDRCLSIERMPDVQQHRVRFAIEFGATSAVYWISSPNFEFAQFDLVEFPGSTSIRLKSAVPEPPLGPPRHHKAHRTTQTPDRAFRMRRISPQHPTGFRASVP